MFNSFFSVFLLLLNVFVFLLTNYIFFVRLTVCNVSLKDSSSQTYYTVVSRTSSSCLFFYLKKTNVSVPPLPSFLWTKTSIFQTTIYVSMCPAGLPGLCQIKTSRTTCPQYAEKEPESELHYAFLWFPLSDCQSKRRKIDMFSIMQLQSPWGTSGSSMRVDRTFPHFCCESP